MTMAEIKEEALRLDPAERAELVETLQVSLLEAPLAEWQTELLDERLDAYEREPSNTVSWEEVKARLRQTNGA